MASNSLAAQLDSRLKLSHGRFGLRPSDFFRVSDFLARLQSAFRFGSGYARSALSSTNGRGCAYIAGHVVAESTPRDCRANLSLAADPGHGKIFLARSDARRARS